MKRRKEEEFNPHAVLKRFAEEDADEREVTRNAETLLMNLDVGFNCVTAADFVVLAAYFLPKSERDAAKDRGKFTVGPMTLAITKAERLVTVSELAREVGMPQRTLCRRVAKLNIKPIRSGARKLYDISELVSVLAK